MADATKTISQSQSGRLERTGWLRRVTGASNPMDGTDQKQTSTSLSVIVPAYNEQYLVETSLGRLKVLGESPLLHLVQVIVVDDGSKDGTAEAIARFRASVEAEAHDEKFRWIWLRHDKNQGKGAAIRTCALARRYGARRHPRCRPRIPS